MALEDAPADHTAVFDNTPVVVLLAILAAFLAAQKHDGIKPLSDHAAQWGRSALQAVSDNDACEIKLFSTSQG